MSKRLHETEKKEEIKGRKIYRRCSAEVAKQRVREAFTVESSTNGRSSGRSNGNKRNGIVMENTNLCDKDSCQEKILKCSLEIAENCACSTDVAGLDIRWFHISQGEHYCYACYEEFYRTNRSCNDNFNRWKSTWTANSRREPGCRVFVAEELLPFWLQCIKCQKWRSLHAQYCANSQMILTFTCDSVLCAQKCSTNTNPCDMDEDKCVSFVNSIDWLLNLAVPPLLQNSPATHFVGQEYFYDQLGLSPTNYTYSGPGQEGGLDEIMQPFNIPHQGSIALCLRPDVMEYDEIINFPEFSSEQILYLGLRNLIIALWAMSPTSWLTVNKCIPYVLCRGLVRIRCVHEVKRILEFLTLKGVVNLGILNRPPDDLISLNLKPKPLKVLIVGAGISGLAASRQLKNFGFDVTVMEARGKIGGRMKEDWSLGVAVGCGAQLLTGVVNNPITLMCYQVGIPYHRLGDDCPLLDSVTGERAETTADKRVDFHFNCLLDAAAEWREKGFSDRSLKDQLMHMHSLFLTQSNMKWSPEEERIFQWQLGNVEFSCGSSMSNVSALHWDQNEQFAQFGGDHALLTQGSYPLLNRLADGLDIRCNTQVKKIGYHKRHRITVTTKANRRFTYDKVLITVPLAVLQLGNIIFDPPLPERKRKAILQLGAGIIEKVAVRFPRKFWADEVKDSDYFGHVPKGEELRGLFNIFYDLSTKNPESKHQSYVLMSYVCGESVNLVNEKKDAQVAEIFVDTLREIFPNVDVPEPLGCMVTHWQRDPCFGMSYSYVKLGGTGEDYDILAKCVENRLYFAGEATNRFFPQTMTGAMLSGIREASKIAFSVKNK